MGGIFPGCCRTNSSIAPQHDSKNACSSDRDPLSAGSRRRGRDAEPGRPASTAVPRAPPPRAHTGSFSPGSGGSRRHACPAAAASSRRWSARRAGPAAGPGEPPRPRPRRGPTGPAEWRAEPAGFMHGHAPVDDREPRHEWLQVSLQLVKDVVAPECRDGKIDQAAGERAGWNASNRPGRRCEPRRSVEVDRDARVAGRDRLRHPDAPPPARRRTTLSAPGRVATPPAWEGWASRIGPRAVARCRRRG